ncbi:hypothetical protein C9439_07300, partial [archaeon SCG-AAA382B04]
MGNNTNSAPKNQSRLDLYGLNDLELKILKQLDEGHYITTIAQNLDYSISHIYRKVKKLEDRGLV